MPTEEELKGELMKVWDENHCVILFLWYSSLKDAALQSLKITNVLDITKIIQDEIDLEESGCCLPPVVERFDFHFFAKVFAQ